MQDQSKYSIRNANPKEFKAIGKLMVEVYSQLDGFPKMSEQPNYYEMLRNVGDLTQQAKTDLLVAITKQGQIGGAVVYFGDMKDYGSGGTATNEKNACGFRLLAVHQSSQGQGLGKRLTKACIKKGKDDHLNEIIIHSTKSMQVAWNMYEKMGFKRSKDLDFKQGDLPVFGFRLSL